MSPDDASFLSLRKKMKHTDISSAAKHLILCYGKKNFTVFRRMFRFKMFSSENAVLMCIKDGPRLGSWSAAQCTFLFRDVHLCPFT